MSKTTTIVIAVLIIGLALAYWKRNWIMTRIGLNKAESMTDPMQDNTPKNNSGITYKECSTGPFKKGCKGSKIETIQKGLNKIHNAGIKVDGYFGQETEDALVANGYGETVEMEDIRKMMELLKS